MKKPTPEERLERIEKAILKLAYYLDDAGLTHKAHENIKETLSPLTDEKENGGN